MNHFDDDRLDDDDDEDDPDAECWQCHGAGVVAVDWNFMPIALDHAPGHLKTAKCPNCAGSGLARDCTYW